MSIFLVSPVNCPPKCDLYCENGFLLDAQGCATCVCLNPCEVSSSLNLTKITIELINTIELIIISFN